MKKLIIFCILALRLTYSTGEKFDPNQVKISTVAMENDPLIFHIDEEFVKGLTELSSCKGELRKLEEELAHLNTSTREKREAGNGGHSEPLAACPEPPIIAHSEMIREQNEVHYSCRENFRFRGRSQSASCTGGKWMFTNELYGICRQSFWSGLEGEFQSELSDLRPGVLITLKATADKEARFVIKVENLKKGRVLVEYSIDLVANSVTSDSQLGLTRHPDTKHVWSRNPVSADTVYIWKIHILKNSFKCEVNGVVMDEYPLTTSLFTATHLTASGDVDVSEVFIEFP